MAKIIFYFVLHHYLIKNLTFYEVCNPHVRQDVPVACTQALQASKGMVFEMKPTFKN